MIIRNYYKQVPRIVYDTVTNWVTKTVPVIKTVYDTVKETAYRLVQKPVQVIKQVIETVMQTGTRLVEKVVPVVRQVTDYVTQQVEESYQVARVVGEKTLVYVGGAAFEIGDLISFGSLNPKIVYAPGLEDSISDNSTFIDVVSPEFRAGTKTVDAVVIVAGTYQIAKMGINWISNKFSGVILEDIISGRTIPILTGVQDRAILKADINSLKIWKENVIKLSEKKGVTTETSLINITGGIVIKSMASKGSTQYVKVGRWMYESEYNTMKSSLKIKAGEGGVTSVATGGKNSWPSATIGQVYVEFEVPANSLVQGGNTEWFTLVSKEANSSVRYVLSKQNGEFLTDITFKNLTSILYRK